MVNEFYGWCSAQLISAAVKAALLSVLEYLARSFSFPSLRAYLEHHLRFLIGALHLLMKRLFFQHYF